MTTPVADRPPASRVAWRTVLRWPAATALALVVLGGVVQTVAFPAAVPEGPLQRSDAPGGTSLVSLTSEYSLFVTLRERAGSAAVVWPASEDPPLYVPYLYAISGIEDVRSGPVPLTGWPGTPPTATGSPIHGEPWWSGTWSLHLDDDLGPPEVLLVRRVPGGIEVADARLVVGGSDVARPAPDASRPTLGVTPSLSRAALVDTLVLGVLLLAGGLLLPHGAVTGAARVALALVVGVALQATVGMLLVPGIWSLVITVATAAVAARAAAGRGPSGWSRADVGPLLTGLAALAAMTTWVRGIGLLRTSPDTFDYLAGARMLADGRFGPAVLELKRGVGQQSLHATGFALGAEGIQSLGPAVLLAGVVLIALLPSASRSRAASAASGLAALVLLASPAVPRMGAFLNSHVLVAVTLLALIALLGVGPVQRRSEGPATVTALVALVAALVVLRPEGTLLVGLVLLGMLRRRDPVDSAAWWALGGATVAWNLLLVVGGLMRPSGPPPLALGMAAVGVAVLLAPWILVRLSPRLLRTVPVIVGSVLWAGALAALILGTTGVTDVRFLRALLTNLGEGVGEWGLLAPSLMILGLWAVLKGEAPEDGAGVLGARWLLIGSIPVLLFAKLGDGLERGGLDLTALLSGGGRVGWGDSVNRSWMHLVLVTLALVVVRSRTPGKVPLTRGLALTALVTVVATLWAPRWVIPAEQLADFERRTVATVRFVGVDDLLVDLVDGRVVEQRIVLPDVAPRTDDGALPVEVCVEPKFATFGRANAGSIHVSLSAGPARSEHVLEASLLRDLVAERFCLTLAGAVPVELVLRVEGSGASIDDTAGLVAAFSGDATGLLVRPATTTLPDGRASVLDAPVAVAVDIDRLWATPSPGSAPTTPRRVSGLFLLLIPVLLVVLVVRDVLPGRRAAFGLVVAGLVGSALTPTLVPHGRPLVPAWPAAPPGVAALSIPGVTIDDGRVLEQHLSPRRAPDERLLRRDPWGRTERVCLTLQIDAVPPGWGSGGLRLSVGPSGTELAIPATAVRRGPLTVCKDVSDDTAPDRPMTHDAPAVAVTLRTEGVGNARGPDGVQLGLTGALDDDGPLRLVDEAGGEEVLEGRTLALHSAREAVGPHEPVASAAAALLLLIGLVMTAAGALRGSLPWATTGRWELERRGPEADQ